MAQYGQSAYWEERYQKDPEPFDWYQRYDALRDILRAVVAPTASVLVAGCGNSRLTGEMWRDGFAPIENVDVSRTVVEQMAARHKDMRGVTWRVMNLTQPWAFADASFDAVIDKGTLDSLLCGDNSTANGARYLSEAARVLRPGGALVVVSYGTPDNRLQWVAMRGRGAGARP
jgi:SAM-dependent methyltransferase